jgi:hypothetical protein
MISTFNPCNTLTQILIKGYNDSQLDENNVITNRCISE